MPPHESKGAGLNPVLVLGENRNARVIGVSDSVGRM